MKKIILLLVFIGYGFSGLAEPVKDLYDGKLEICFDQAEENLLTINKIDDDNLFAEKIRECLVKNGFDVDKETVEEIIDQYENASFGNDSDDIDESDEYYEENLEDEDSMDYDDESDE